jgi:hypothetical protein
VNGSRARVGRGAKTVVACVAAVMLIAACSGSTDESGSSSTSTSTTATGVDGKRADVVGRDAFLAGYPLVTTTRTMQTFAKLFGVNTLYVGNGLANPSSRLVVAPNRDTVYLLSVMDLRAGPMVLTLPAIPDRYHVVQLIDAWMESFGLIGTRTTGGRGGSWLIVPPGSDVATPKGFHRLESPTSQAFMLGRIRAVDDADAKVAAAIGRRATLEPLDPPGAAIPPMAAPAGTPPTVGANGVAYFDELGDALAINPPTNRLQRRAIDAAAPLGVGADRHPSSEASGPELADLQAAVDAGRAALANPKRAGGRVVNGWNVNVDLGKRGKATTVEEQALIARYFWGPVPATEAIYPRATEGSDGQPLDGARQYRIHFAKDQIPPVDAFWSVTVYGPDMFPVLNPTNRYALSGDTPGLVTNPDGSIDLYLQHDAPPGHEANWLPVPEGPFNLIMRLYLPQAPIRNGTYDYPPVEVVAPG